MAYKKSYGKSYKKKPTYYGGVRMNRRGIRTKWNWADLARGASLALETLNAEKKHFDVETVPSVPSTGVVYSLNRAMAQGITNNTYVGNSIRMKSIALNCQVGLNASANSTRVRFAIILDTRPQASVAAYTDIYQSANLASFLNLDDEIGRFKVLATRYVTVTDSQLEERQFSIFRKLDLHCKFNDSTVPVKNELLIAMISDEATNIPAVRTITRLRYYDN